MMNQHTHTVQRSITKSQLQWKLLQLFKSHEEDDVPGSQTQPVWPEAFIEGEEPLVSPGLHESI